MNKVADEPTDSIRNYLDKVNWAETPLGPRAYWPENLKTALGIVLDSQFPMFIAWGPERIFLYNDAYASILGKKHPAALGMKFEVLWAEIWNDLLPLIQSVDAGNPVYQEDMRLIMNRNGFDEETYFTFSYSPIRCDSEKVFGLYCAVVETTKRKLSEDALRESQENLVGTLDSMSDAFYSVDKNWKVTAVNKNLTIIANKNPQELIGKDARELWFSGPGQKTTKFWSEYHRCMNDRVPVSFVEYYEPFDLWTQARAFPKADGGMAIFVYDIGDIKRAEEALAAERLKTEAQLKKDKSTLLQILENTPGAVAMVSGPEFTFAYTNTKYRELFLSGKNRTGEKVSDVLPESREQGFIALLGNVYKTGQSFKGTEIPYELHFADGSRKTIYLNFVYEPVRDEEGQIESILAAAFDVTELVQSKKGIEDTAKQLRKAKEEAENANLSKTAFLANMSHEIRTPMNAVMGFAEILRDKQLTEAQRQDAVNRIDRSGRALLKLIDDILDIAKVESGKLAIEKIRFSPIEVVTEVMAMLKLQAEQKGIAINTRFSSRVPEIVSSDPARFRQILTNLLGNAVKFTLTGEVKLEVDVMENGTSKSEFLVVKVTDSGIGISEQDHGKLFQPFAQADETISRQFGGSGLGLVLSKRLAEQLGGELELSYSQPGKGSQFTFWIEAGPFDNYTMLEAERNIKTEAVENPSVQHEALNAARILVVDDIQDNQYLMRQYLESAGARVDIASDGKEAISKALHQDYDLVIMDIQMPVVDGIQATTQLRGQGYKTPILALTAHAMKSEIQRSLQAGCNEHLTKPISKRTLISAVSKFIN